MHKLIILLLALTFAACEKQANTTDNTSNVSEVSDVKIELQEVISKTHSLSAILASQTEEAQARYSGRHPKETLEFFDVEPGMTILEALPGGGWYSKILLPYLGDDGHLIGVDYALDMWPKFGFFDDTFLEEKKTWVETWTSDAKLWRNDDSTHISAFVFGSLPPTLEGSADRVLFIRALHNLARFENNGGYLTIALTEAFKILKPGGIVGIVQHEARDNMPNEWADGSRGYLKKSFIVEKMTQAGFEFVAESNINANSEDQPSEADIVWRLPPSLSTSSENPELREQLQAVGESNRMTLKFKKPE